MTKGGNTVQYLYDATGRKLSQTVLSGTTTKSTDYAGEFIYENDLLQFINHEEGRIVTSTSTLVASHTGSALTGVTNYSGGSSSLQTINGETYVKVTAGAGASFPGIYQIGGVINVQVGDVYKIRVKGYSVVSGKNVNVWVESNNGNNNYVWPGAILPAGAANESWIEETFSITSGVTTVDVGLLMNGNANGTDAFYLNEFQLIKVSVSARFRTI